MLNHPKHQKVFDTLDALSISYEVHYHPPIPTIETAMEHWKVLESTHCKNIFLRNHKGNKHYLVIFHFSKMLNISDLEKRLKQGKLSFASEQRMEKYLDIKPGSVSPFGIINDDTKHVYLFIDANLLKSQKLSFHPNDNTATVVISKNDFLKFLNNQGNSYEFTYLYDNE